MNIENDADHRWAGTVLAQAVETEPELGFQPEDVLARARRDITRRRAVVTGVLTVAALAAIGLLLGRGGLPRSEVQVGNRAPAIVAAPPETTVYGVEGPLVIDAHSREMTTELAGAHPVPAGVTASTDKSYGGQPLVFYKMITGQYVNSYYAQATLTDSHGAGHLIVQVLRTQTGMNCGANPYLRSCHTTILADGTRVTVQRIVEPPVTSTAKQTIQWVVELVRTNGTAVDVLCGNWSLDGDPNTGGITHATGAEPPLSENTVVRLAELPDLIP